jgi:hypothetical protein
LLADFEAKTVAYFYARLKRIYGRQFEQAFTDKKTRQFSNDRLIENQREWSKAICKLSVLDINRGMDTLIDLIGADDDYRWPNIGATVQLCKPLKSPKYEAMTAQLEHKNTADWQAINAKGPGTIADIRKRFGLSKSSRSNTLASEC